LLGIADFVNPSATDQMLGDVFVFPPGVTTHLI